MENKEPSTENIDHNQITNTDHNMQSSSSPSLFPIAPINPSTSIAFSGQTSNSSQGSDRNSRLRNHNYPPSPSRIRLDSEYSSRLQQNHQNLSVISPPGIRRGRSRNFSIMRGGSFESSEESRASNTRSAFFTPERSFSSSSGKPGHINSLSPNTYGSQTPWTTPSNTNRSSLASVSIDSDTGYSDRFIPSRATSNLSFQYPDSEGTQRASSQMTDASNSRNLGNDANNVGTEPDTNTAEGTTTNTSISRGSDGSNSQALLNALLRSELLGSSPDIRSPTTINSNENTSIQRESNLFKFQSPRMAYSNNVLGDSSSSVVNSFNLSPIGSASSHRFLAAPQKRKRKIGKVPFKVLDAPSLQDDFYLNLVDWSSQNVLAVGLGSCVYLWSAYTSKVTKLCDLTSTEDIVTSVSWTQLGTHLAVGTNHGEIQIWDSVKCSMVRSMVGHSARIGTLAWNGSTLASGSRDRLICVRDLRARQNYTTRLSAHKQEVCGLKWSHDEPSQLASGGNDNKLLVWDIKNHTQPVHRFADHTAAVKAISWSPHQHGLLASGGGTADRCIRFWNTLSGTCLSCMDTGSQVCNLAWSQNCNEIVSTHGYSLNQIVVWRYPSMTKVATLTGHTYRVLYLAVSPDGSTIVTGAGDETLRFWQVFPGPRSHDKGAGSGLLFPNSPGSIIR